MGAAKEHLDGPYLTLEGWARRTDADVNNIKLEMDTLQEIRVTLGRLEVEVDRLKGLELEIVSWRA